MPNKIFRNTLTETNAFSLHLNETKVQPQHRCNKRTRWKQTKVTELSELYQIQKTRLTATYQQQKRSRVHYISSSENYRTQ